MNRSDRSLAHARVAARESGRDSPGAAGFGVLEMAGSLTRTTLNEDSDVIGVVAGVL
ncbi:MAG: hypothetical protein QF921_04125 [Pseudomonadales bacterium]|nr:hypothetical protein [Pseudomonadales bacterium]MDP6472244.1 hypothetical protein [Pseudomonadales bacterium]MDP6826504.1 hypothetical protein [Pseudomonadales bacterium]MDP6970689.1 hypothetical protein [Pseudomonadales bacterium]